MAKESVSYRVSRSPRFRVEASVLLWPDGENGARAIRAQTANISRTGLCVTGEFNKPIGSALRFEVKLPAPIGATSHSVLCGWGRVVRHLTARDESMAFATTMERFTIVKLSP
jgi:hypothetical protein